MRITVNTVGTRGDVQPYVALGRGLDKAGHDVCIVTHQLFEPFVRSSGLGFYPLQSNPRQVLIQQRLSEIGGNPFRVTRFIRDNLEPVMQDIFTETLAGNAGSDLMVNSGLALAGWHVAEKLGTIAIAAFLWPTTPSRHQMGAIGPLLPSWLPFAGVYRYLSAKLFNQLSFNLMLPLMNRCRQEVLALPPVARRQYWFYDSPNSTVPILYGFSPAIVGKPPDWGRFQQIAGYWFLDTAQDFVPERRLTQFLAAGPPPVCIGFGSVVDHEQAQVTRLVVQALRLCDQRGILLGGWSQMGSDDLPASVYRTEAVPHDWLFPRVAAAVHHGGAGTTAAALRAGLPSVIIPVFGDQFFWARRVEQLGAAPKPIPRKRLTARKLAQALSRAVSDREMVERAGQLGRRIRQEDGVGDAVRLIETYARQGHF